MYKKDSILKKLINREVNNKYNKEFNLYNFKNLKKSKKYELVPNNLVIIELVISDFYIFVLTICGNCMVFEKTSNKQLFILNNIDNKESIRSIYYNKFRNELFILSLNELTNYRYLCPNILLINRVHMIISYKLTIEIDEDIMIDYNNNKNITLRKKLNNLPSIVFPGFYEFDSENKMILSSNGFGEINIFSMVDYSLLFNYNNIEINDVKLSPDKLLISYNSVQLKETNNNYDIKIDDKLISWKYYCKNDIYNISIESNKMSNKTKYILYLPTGNDGEIIDFIELFDNILFLKYRNKNCIILDINKSINIENNLYKINPKQICVLKGTKALDNSSYLFLYESKKFLIFSNKGFISMYNNIGNLVGKCENHMFYLIKKGITNITSDSKNKHIISVCLNKKKINDIRINFTCLKTCKKVHDISLNDIETELNDNNKGGLSLIYYGIDNNEIYLVFNSKLLVYK